MSNIQIPNLPAAIALNGNEQLETVQAGVSVKTTVAQLGAYAVASFTATSPLMFVGNDIQLTTVPVVLGGTGGTTQQAAAEGLNTAFPVLNLTALKALTSRPPVVRMSGYATLNDGGGGDWYWVAGDTTTPDDILVAQPASGTAGRYFRVYTDFVNVMWAGAAPDAVFDTATGAWTGADNTAPFRNAFLTAAASLLNWYCPAGNYIITGTVVLGNETPSNMEFYGDGDKSVVIPKINGQLGSFSPFVIGQGQINANGVTTGSPTYYLPSFVTSGSNLLPISTTAGLTVGVWAQMMDLTQPILNFADGGLDGIGTTKVFLGQAVKIIGLDDGTGDTFDIVYGTYDSATGETFIRVTAPTTFANGSTITLSGLTGTGAFASLNGSWTTFASSLSGPGTTDFYFTGTSGLGVTTITGGTVTWAGDGDARVVISPAAEFNYAGTTTSPGTNATCFRTYRPEVGNIVFRDMRFSYDRTEPPFNAQTVVNAARLNNTLFTRLSFEWPARSIAANGAINGSISQCNFTNGGAFTYCVVFDDGASGWRISDCYAQGGRHFIQGGLSAQYFMASCHVRIENSQFSNFYLAPLTAHGYARDWIFEGNEVWGGTTDTGSAGLILRGLRLTSRNNRITGCNTGVVFSPNQGCILDGGEIINCNTGVAIARTLEAQIRNYPFIQGSRDAHIYVYPYEYLRPTSPFPGINITAKVAPTRYVYFIDSGTYDTATGAVSITLTQPFIFNAFVLTATGMANNGAGLIRVTVADVGTLETGQTVDISGTVGTTEADGTWYVTRISDTTFDLNGSAFVNAWVSGGSCAATASVLLDQLTGTGAASSLNGSYTVTSGARGVFTFAFTAASGLGAITIDTGTVTFMQRPHYGDVMWLAYTAGAVPPMADTTRIDIKSDARAPVFTTWEDDGVTPLGFSFPGEFSVGVTTKTANFSFVPYLYATYMFDTTSGNVTGTLPDATTLVGMRVQAKKTNTGGSTATIATTSSQTIDGSATKVLTDNEFVTLIAEGTSATANWYIV